jgi:hypothetical protein
VHAPQLALLTIVKPHLATSNCMDLRHDVGGLPVRRSRKEHVLESVEDAALFDDAAAVTSAALAASRLLVAVSLRSLAAAEQR